MVNFNLILPGGFSVTRFDYTRYFSYLVRKKSLALLKLNLAVEGVNGEKAGPHSHVGGA